MHLHRPYNRRVSVTVAPRIGTTPTAPAADLRHDVQALRAIAVLAVLLYHLWPARLTGGFIGVDVFFVISGFLITSHLVREVDRTGRIRLAAFWARRAKRLLPASLLVLAATAVGIIAVVPRAQWQQFLSEVGAATLYVENWFLAASAVDYHAATDSASPVRHFWTLSAEEQFYILLPLLLLATLWVVRGDADRRRRSIIVVIAAATAISFVYSLWLTATSPSVSYFSTFARAWEFGAGALLAFAPAAGSAAIRRAGPWVGIAIIALGIVGLSGDTPFPGVAALLPVVGTGIVLWTAAGSGLARVGAFRPVAFLGATSYAIYLWHWPLIVLVPYVTERPLGTIDKVAILCGTILIAWISTRFIEEPVRFSPRLLGGGRRPRTVAVWSAVAMAAVLAIVGAGLVTLQSQSVDDVAALRAVRADPPRCFGAASQDTANPCENPILNTMVMPDPAIAKRDDENRDDCWGTQEDGTPNICTLVDPPQPTRTVFAVGDSHNNTLIGAYRAMAESRGWRMQVAGLGGCYLTDARQGAPSEESRERCESWRSGIVAAMQADPPDAVIVTNSAGDRRVEPPAGQTLEEATVAGLVSAWKRLPDVPIIAIRDNPVPAADALTCVSQSEPGDAAAECSIRRSEAFRYFDGQPDAVAATTRARLVDLSDLYCNGDRCSPVIGGVLVYRDKSHVTATWAESFTPILEKRVVEQLGW